MTSQSIGECFGDPVFCGVDGVNRNVYLNKDLDRRMENNESI